MKTLIATLLATAAGASFAAAPTAALNHDAATYNNIKQKADAAYQAAATKCPAMSGNDKNVCMAEAKLARVQAETNALSRYYNTPAGRQSMRTVVANAEYDVARTKCDGSSGADKDNCLNNAKSVHTAALADAKADRAPAAATATAAAAASASTANGGSMAGATGAGPGVLDKCAQAGGDAKTGCVIETKPSALRDGAANAAANAADTTRAAASTAASKTRDAAATATEKTKDVAATAAEKTKEVAQTAVEKTKQAASTVADKTENSAAVAAPKARVVAADTAITAKVKAGLVKETRMDSLSIHVETEKGVVMLSGFVNNKDEADKAVQVAKNVDGVANVRSAIQVK
ncbi:BON domain-containing protein [Massilia sp. 9096]|uniref:BON domain-containing protein n=1 Tax=Massilia sp. 9096 TaxID=1500894 RepID=UPI000690D431|nr:BON domain-containing protein [Massilia sp. 9096]